MPPNEARIEADRDNDHFIVFSLAGEIYGAALLSVREVIKQGDVKPVPYMVPHFKGVINLRGQIVGIVDLRLKFGLKATDEKKNIVLIVETPQGLLGAVIDELIGVKRILGADIEKDTPIETKIPSAHFVGIAKSEGRLVNIVDLSECLASEDFKTVKIKKAAS